MYWALIKNNKVVNAIKAKEDFINRIQQDYDYCIDVTNMEERPTIGWLYENGQFINPFIQIRKQERLEEIRKLRDEKLKESDYMVNEIILGLREDKEAVAQYRQSLLDMTNQFKNEDGSANDLLDDNFSFESLVWPEKP